MHIRVPCDIPRDDPAPSPRKSPLLAILILLIGLVVVLMLVRNMPAVGASGRVRVLRPGPAPSLPSGAIREVTVGSAKTGTYTVSLPMIVSQLAPALCGDDACEGDETCESCAQDCGACVCGDGLCSPSAGEDSQTCSQDCTPPDGTPCDDGDACTEDDKWTGGECRGTSIVCDDELGCTDDSCAEGVCLFQVAADSCLVDSVCFEDQDVDPGCDCRLCSTGDSQSEWSPAACYEATEATCDGLDNDCDGDTDEGEDICPAVSRATAACTEGACVIGDCEDDWADCNGTYSDGCERWINSVTDCGACDYLCQAPNATTGCSSGTCIITGCSLGYGNCNGVYGDGCEVYLNHGGGSCAGGSYLGSVAGDTGSQSLGPVQDHGEAWYIVGLSEDNNNETDLTMRVVLDSAVDTDYDLYLYNPSCDTPVGSSTVRGSTTDTVYATISDVFGSDDSTQFYVEVRWYSGSSCSGWSLTVDGNVVVP